jgi:hypothetical protein
MKLTEPLFLVVAANALAARGGKTYSGKRKAIALVIMAPR